MGMEWWLPIGSLMMTGIVIPMLGYFFRENKRQHEESRAKVDEVKQLLGKQDITLGQHEVRISSLEQWRLYGTRAERLSDVHATYNPQP